MTVARILTAVLLAFALLIPVSGARAALISGTVTDPMGFGAGGVDVDVHDAVTGQKISTTNDSTDADGTFEFVVPAGRYDLVFNAPGALRLVSRRVLSVVVVEPATEVGVIRLEAGAVLSGRVVRAVGGTAVFDADTDIDLSLTGERIITPADNTDLSGDFSVVVPFGLVDLTIQPDLNARLVAHRSIGIQITGDLDLGTIALASGFLITGTVGTGGIPLADVEVDVFESSTGAQIPTPGSRSDGNGRVDLVLAPGAYSMRISPPIDSGRSRVLLDYGVGGNQMFNVNVPVSLMSVRLPDSGRLVLAGTRYRPAVQFRNNSGVVQSILAVVQVAYPAGGITRNAFPPVTRQVPASGNVLEGQASIRIPGSLAPRFRDVPLHLIVSVFDPSGQTLIDSDLIEFRVR